MATPNLDFQNFYSSTLSSTITAADTTIYLDTLPTPSEGYLVIEPDSSANREVVWYTSKGANFVTVPTSGGRGVGGTSAVAHSSGATVNMNNVAEMWTAIKDGSANTGMHQWFDESFADYVYSGATIAQASGLIASISSGVVYINGRRLTLNNASKTFTASKDTYVDVVALSGSNTATLSYTEVNSGVSGSAPVSNGMHIGMVRSNASLLATIYQIGTDKLNNYLKPTNPATTNVSTTTDANGWDVVDLGALKIYKKRVTFTGFTVYTYPTLLTVSSNTLPSGMSTISTNTFQYSYQATANAGALVVVWEGSSSSATTNWIATSTDSSRAYTGNIDMVIISA